ncbi:MAG: hypothetical protein AAFR79_01150 [Pseudomonadota bacterium]
MVRLIKILLLLAVAGVVGLAVFALFADLPAPVRAVSEPIDLPSGTE